MELQACSVHDFLITSGICAFTREFRVFTLGFRAFIREFHAFTREFCTFTREFHAFTREFHNFTREFHTLLVNSAYRLTFFFSLFSFSERKGQSLSALSLFLFPVVSSGQPFYDGGQKKIK
ncbi:hypothetical protein RCO48_03755 [Peribacillus frigoritolerans]|nr:hypothetical protein [Peribacillus frigoritolerans]